MTFNFIAAKKAHDCLSFINQKHPLVMDIGVQTPSIGKNLINNYVKLDSCLTNKQEIYYKKIIDEKSFTTKDFFLALGYDNYFSIDINGANNSYQFDLNHDINESKYSEKFDLVINNGTGEHIFNQYSLFKNMHYLTKKNGVMLHIMPFLDWINHGFYNFNPILYADLAAANDYRILDISLANRNGAELSIIDKEKLNIMYEQVKPNYQTDFKTLLFDARKKLGENILLVAILEKIKANDFAVPLQGKYLDDISSIETEYVNQGIGSSSSFGQEKDSIKREKLKKN